VGVPSECTHVCRSCHRLLQTRVQREVASPPLPPSAATTPQSTPSAGAAAQAAPAVADQAKENWKIFLQRGDLWKQLNDSMRKDLHEYEMPDEATAPELYENLRYYLHGLGVGPGEEPPPDLLRLAKVQLAQQGHAFFAKVRCWVSAEEAWDMITKAVRLRKTRKKALMKHGVVEERRKKRSLSQIIQADERRDELPAQAGSAERYHNGGFDLDLLRQRAAEDPAASKRAKSFIVDACALCAEQIDGSGKLSGKASFKEVFGANPDPTIVRRVERFCEDQEEREGRDFGKSRRSKKREDGRKRRCMDTATGRGWWEESVEAE